MRQLSICFFLLLSWSIWAAGCDEDESQGGENSDALCHDNEDNDGDGSVDCEDVECAEFCQDTGEADEWRTTWVASQQETETDNNPTDPPGLADNTLRQMIQITIGGSQMRFTFSNEYGEDPVTLTSAAVALSLGKGDIDEETHTELTFSGEASVTIQDGEQATSDPVEWEIPALSDLAVTVRFDDAPPSTVTGHPGSRTDSYIMEGDAVSNPDVEGSTSMEHWYFLSQVDVMAPAESRAIVTLGDSITDGRGSATNMNNRWPNLLSVRLQENEGTENIAVLNHGIGGNSVVRGGLGPTAVRRFDRDVLEDPLGVKWLIILEGINDLNGNVTAEEIIDAFTDMAESAHEEEITVIGGTIMPCEGHYYFDEDLETKREEINKWIRTTDLFDDFIDFDEITADPDNPTRLSSDINSVDGLHPSVKGYQIMADAIDLSLFED